MSMATSDMTVEILKDIRDGVRGTNARLDAVESTLTHRLEAVGSTLSHRLGAVEATLLELAEQQRFVVRYTKAISERDAQLEPRILDLEVRVDKLEAK
jgi:hypothetical protein